MKENQIVKDAFEASRTIAWKPNERRVLITGATGVVGSHIAATIYALSEKGEWPRHVMCMGGSRSWPTWLNFIPTANRIPRVDSNSFESSPAGRFDTIFHAAGYGQPVKFGPEPHATIRVAVQGSLALLEKVEPDGEFIFLSSSEVYSGVTQLPHTEDVLAQMPPTHPRAPYVYGKLAAEAAIAHADIARGLSIRLALAYGPGFRRDDTRVLNELIMRAVLEGRTYIRDSGLAQRTYCYASDATRMIFELLDAKAASGAYNVGGVGSIAVRDLAKLVSSLSNTPLEIPELPAHLDSAPDIVESSLVHTLSAGATAPKVGMELGVSRTIDWCRLTYGG